MLERHTLIRFLFFSILFSFVINLPEIVEFHSFAGYPPSSFIKADEAFYLQQALDVASGLPDAAYYSEHRLGKAHGEEARWDPHIFSDLLLGGLGKAFGFTANSFGIFLDLLFGFGSFFSFLLFFYILCRSQLVAVVSAFVALVLPWHLMPSQLFPFQWSFEYLVSPSYQLTLSLPFQRGVSTQASYPIFGLAFCFAVLAIEDIKRRWIYAGLAGLLISSLLYIYFFAWGAALGVLLTFAALRLFQSRSWATISPLCVGILAGHVLVAIPAFSSLYSLLTAPQLKQSFVVTESPYSSYWFLSLPDTLLGFVVLGVMFCCRSVVTQRLAALILSCVFAEFVLMNFQPLLNTPLQAWHFPIFYTQPVMIGGIAALLLQSVARIEKFTKASYFLSLGLIAIVSTAYVLKSFYYVFADNDGKYERIIETTELLHAIAQHSRPDDVVAMMTFERPFENELPDHVGTRTLSNSVWIYARRPVLRQDKKVPLGVSIEEELTREFLTSWLFSGSAQWLWPCKQEMVQLPGDIMSWTWTLRQIQRARVCPLGEELLKRFDICGELQKYRIDYVIWEKKFGLVKPDWFSSVTDLVWRSTRGMIELHRLDQSELIAHACSTSPSPRIPVLPRPHTDPGELK